MNYNEPIWIDPQIKPIMEKSAEQLQKMQPPWTRPIGDVRQKFEDSMKFWNDHPISLPEVRNETIPGPYGDIPVRIYLPSPATESQPALIFFHGGGWVAGSPDSHDSITRHIAKRSNLPILSIGYGLAPERHFPDTVIECVDAVKWIRRNSRHWSIAPHRLALGGDSAGANLSLASAIQLRDDGETWLKYLLLMYPALRPHRDSESHRHFGGIEFGNSPERYDWFWDCYVPDKSERENPLADPTLANMNGLPPVYLLAAGLDPLSDDVFTLAEKLRHGEVPFNLKFVPGVPHGFLHMAKMVDSASFTLDILAEELQKTMTGK